jgi:hypothetical protein
MMPTLPDFTRYQWASTTDRQWYSPLVQSASNAFHVIERLSVAKGIRKAAWQYVSYHDLITLTDWAREHDLVVIPIYHANIGNAYTSSGDNPGSHNAYRVVITRPENYKEVIPFDGDEHIGNMLGFPSCCRKAFAETWAKGAVDTTWEQVATGRPSVWASTLLRWMGLRFVPHLPCSFSCSESEDMGMAFYEVGVKNGYTEEMLFINEALNWPMSASRLFGIAEMITPPLKIVTRSTWTPTKEEFFVPGAYTKVSKDLWTDNGFSDPASMRSAHEPLIQAIREHAPRNACVLDLGCGNGLLLKRAKFYRPDIRIGGCDTNVDAITRASKGTLEKLSPWYPVSIQAWTKWDADLMLINPARLQEMDIKNAQDTRDQLVSAKQVIAYCYSDYDDLGKLCAGVGLPAPQMLAKTPHVQVGLIQHVN